MLKGFVSGEEKDIKRITMKGKNLFDGGYTVAIISVSGNTATVYTASSGRIAIVKCEPNTIYTVKKYGVSNRFIIAESDIKPVSGTAMSIIMNDSSKSEYSFTTSNTTQYVAIYCSTSSEQSEPPLMLNLGSTALPYEPYGYQEGWEVRDNQDRLIWGREDDLQTTTGTLPFKGYGVPVKVKSLLGNGSQTGTPTPDNPVMPELVGVRTGNLFDETATNTDNGYIPNGYVRADGTENTNRDYRASEYIAVNASAVYTLYCAVSLNAPAVCFYDSDKNYISGESYSGRVTIPFTTPQDTSFLRLSCRAIDVDVIMLNLGSESLSYEPYGWKLPFENHGENLWDEDYTGISTTIKYVPIHVGSGDFTLSTTTPYTPLSVANVFLLSGNVSSGASTTTNGAWLGQSRTVSSDNGYITIAFRQYQGSSNPADYKTMLNPGSTPKPYSPYLNATIPVYLGEVPTVRRVKKLVLTGGETYTYDPSYSRFIMVLPNAKIEGLRLTQVYCTHFISVHDGRPISEVPNNSIYSSDVAVDRFFIKTTDYTSAADFKSYLAAQYAAGTPVTVWYVLATPETGIVNEPLAKIGDYADELNDTSATLPEIPTTTGQNTLTVDTTLAPSNLTVKGHVKALT